MENVVGQTQNVQVPNYSGVHINIINPSVVAPGAAVPASNVNASTTYTTNPAYPANYYTQNLAQPAQVIPEEKKTEKREIVQLTDAYISELEKYLSNGKDQSIRLIGAKEVLARLHEDDSRKNDKGLNALINKMLRDKDSLIRFMAMSALESGDVAGNNESIEILKGIQQQKIENDKKLSESEKVIKKEDALKASRILLKLSGNTIEKEFEVENKTQK